MENHWTTQAACRGTDTDLFYPEVHYRDNPKLFHEMKTAALAICARCPVREACLAEALRNKEKHGIWGGTMPEERYRIRGIKRRGPQKVAS